MKKNDNVKKLQCVLVSYTVLLAKGLCTTRARRNHGLWCYLHVFRQKKKEKPHRFCIYKVYRKHIGQLVLTVMAWRRCTEKGTEWVCLQCRQHSTKRPHWLLVQTSFQQNQQKDHISNKQFLNTHNTVLKNIAQSNEEVVNRHSPQKMESRQNKSRKMCVIGKVAAVPPKAKKKWLRWVCQYNPVAKLPAKENSQWPWLNS